ncbi:transmembrane protein 242-like [Hylaeus anthracinus]|uniref:transmembrane protein 242 n=1 Tax=Hylaeus volcanicus TaxID=313075 RepID=UPI0023B83EAD|nr:transmembrane protein 242 [Hylaeus volcanicus]XP_054009295.1 transmembrane protein 242-like [Hylaeus anthracinus]XP_054015695.1 transmembrane protein 242-like [Hylaeus anthracinus]
MSDKSTKKQTENLYATIFLSGVAGLSAMIGFCSALSSAKKQDTKSFDMGVLGGKGLPESGAMLATRALFWGSVWAISGCGLLFYSIWKFSGAKTAEEFRLKVGSLLPRIPKNDPPQSRTEFENLTDLLRYVSEEWGKEK